jgi:peptidoglycan hydrolase CwlO-like protein
MLLLLQASQNVTISQSTLVSIVIAILGFIGVLITILHKDMTGKIADAKESSKEGMEKIHADLKPLTITVALHEDKIKELNKGHEELAEKINKHDGRINQLEHQIDKLLP